MLAIETASRMILIIFYIILFVSAPLSYLKGLYEILRGPCFSNIREDSLQVVVTILHSSMLTIGADAAYQSS